jgi:hypothetical protein
MSHLKRAIQTVEYLAAAHRLVIHRSFKQKGVFGLEGSVVVSPHSLARQAIWQNGSIIFERSFAKKSGVSLCGKLCAWREYQE